MPYGLYISAEGARAQSFRMETIAHNLANVNTVGYKRDVAGIAARHTEAITRSLDYAGSRSINDVGGGVQVRETLTDYAPGAYKDTGGQFDFAIKGDGFFAVAKDGREYLTRAGDFQVDAGGNLITTAGYAVLGSDGAPVTLDPSRPPEITLDGKIIQDGATVELAVMAPESLDDLTKAGENLFENRGESSPVDPSRRSVSWGVLEHSGVQPVTTLTDMIAASRAFEANVRLIQNQDHMTGTLINRVLSSR